MEILMTVSLVLALTYALSQLIVAIRTRRDGKLLMLAYECYKPPENTKLTTRNAVGIALRNEDLSLDEFRFLLKTIASSGVGEDTHCTRNILDGDSGGRPKHGDAVSEMDDVIFATLDALFSRTGVSPAEIDLVVVNVSLFAPAPSLSSRIVNRYAMRDDVASYNLSGMGCSASVVGVDLVRQFFRTRPNKLAVLVSTESIGPSWYDGKEKSMMLSNCLFRSGGCSMLFTNKRSLRDRAVLKLRCLVRTHVGADDEAYGCVVRTEDDRGYPGIRLSKKLSVNAVKALRINLRILAPKILPLREILVYGLSTILPRNFDVGVSSETRKTAEVEFKKGVEHFCIHPGGRAVIDGVGRSLGLSEHDLEPSRMALHRFGNTSTSGLWYALAYMEAKERLKQGDNIMMMSFGAGIKCNTCVWEVMRDLNHANVWKGMFDGYPPSTLHNPILDNYGWINTDDTLRFARIMGI